MERKKRIILIGRSAAGKTTLCQRINNEELKYHKTQSMFPPAYSSMFAKPAVGVVTKQDLATEQQVAHAKQYLKAAGAGELFVVSSVTGEGVEALVKHLDFL